MVNVTYGTSALFSPAPRHCVPRRDPSERDAISDTQRAVHPPDGRAGAGAGLHVLHRRVHVLPRPLPGRRRPSGR